MRVQAQTGQMAELLKFFTDFDAGGDPRLLSGPAEEESTAEAAVDPQAIRDAAYQDGLRDGFERATRERNHAVEAVLQALAAKLIDAQYRADHAVDTAAKSVARMLIQTVMKLLPAACGRYGAREVADVARAVLPALRLEPRVELAVHPSITSEIEAELTRLGADVKQRAVVTPNSGLVPGDVRITWQDGSATRDTTELMQRVATVFEEFGLLDPVAVDASLAEA